MKIFSKIFFVIILTCSLVYSQQVNKALDRKSLLVGKWINTINKTSDGKKFNGLKCEGVIQFFSNGQYSYRQCNSVETGKWKISKDEKTIFLTSRHDKEMEKLLGTHELGQVDMPLVYVTDKEFISRTGTEDVGSVKMYYTRLK